MEELQKTATEVSPPQQTKNSQQPSTNQSTNIIGVLILSIGAFLLLRNLGIINAQIDLREIITTWWPLILVHLGVDQIAKNHTMVKPLWYVVLIAAVAYALLGSIG